MADFKTDTNNQIFQDAVKSLHLRFPVAEIERATKYRKGAISNFLNDKQPVSDAFLQTFSEAFKIDLKNFGYTKGLARVKETKNPDINQGLSSIEFNAYLIKENDSLKETIKELLKNINKTV